MSAAATVLRLVLGAVFVASGLLKLRDPSWPATARAFGAPGWAAAALPWAELAVGAGLGAQLRPAAVVAAVLLVLFTVLVARHLARGERVPCACFGSASSRPIGGATVARNVVLLALAGLAAV